MPDADAAPRGSRGGPRVAVCALTYRRPAGLRRLLAGLAGLRVPPELAGAVEVVIVDNDPAGSESAVVADAAARTPLPIRSEIEPRRGIAYGRNRADVGGRWPYAADPLRGSFPSAYEESPRGTCVLHLGGGASTLEVPLIG